jgi:hypothetical protein
MFICERAAADRRGSATPGPPENVPLAAERLIEIGDEIGDRLDTDRHPN